MKIESVSIQGFRNFSDANINFNKQTLIIGSNDIGKTNLVYAIRLLLDKSLSERDIEPSETDFRISDNGEQSDEISITIKFSDIKEDAALSILKEHVSDSEESYFVYKAYRNTLDYKIFVGSTIENLEAKNSRFYLRHINLKYIQSSRNLKSFIDKEKKSLLKSAQNSRTEVEIEHDEKLSKKISIGLENINQRVRKLNYVKDATQSVNNELTNLSHHNAEYSVHLDSGAIKVNQFIDNLELGAKVSGSNLMLGGDGRNNQILLSLWKAKSEREIVPEHEVVFYCIEEPEAHLHPHQQRKLASYLSDSLIGQSIITSHSPQIASKFSPNSIISLVPTNNGTKAASRGCSELIKDTFVGMGYRMSILPAEAFFAKCVLLVEGPSEVLFYNSLASKIGVDLDYNNISILSVDGVDFGVYTRILDAMGIKWTLRTDNDISKVPYKDEMSLAGINRGLSILGLNHYENVPLGTSHQDTITNGTWQNASNILNPEGIFLSKVDLENDLYSELKTDLDSFADSVGTANIVSYLQSKKALRMSEFLRKDNIDFDSLRAKNIVRPLLLAEKLATE
ncbi:ATP-dependent nuclease [Vibrio cyclitrophicus]|uniref:ATP-dependent nuclease n=1 Tax=Vibrio TaxID=662 RepID=UPI0002D58019|nr:MULTISPECIES: AAA family ATPase [Vibrio]MBE8605765.1 AAA family ATPase [Vibrio sp. OPT10]OEE05058.1 ATP-dependent endonuclease [Vibrio cyclitrophicus ZF264]PMI71171.1 ATP-dependent endonuclease [Vibrio cyclitrophicus]